MVKIRATSLFAVAINCYPRYIKKVKSFMRPGIFRVFPLVKFLKVERFISLNQLGVVRFSESP